jgi:hypothetical protein
VHRLAMRASSLADYRELPQPADRKRVSLGI